MACQQEQLITPVRLRGAAGQEGEMSPERQEQEVAVDANQPALPVPAAGCHASVRMDADQLRDLGAPPLNYQTPL